MTIDATEYDWELRRSIPLPKPELESVLPLAEDDSGYPFYWCPDCYRELAAQHYEFLRKEWEKGGCKGPEPTIDQLASTVDLWGARATGVFCDLGHDL